MRVYTHIMTSHCYCDGLRRTTRRIGAMYDAALAPLGINIAQFSLMRKIWRRETISLTELGRVAELDRSTVGRNVRVLERMGLVTMSHGQDQRETMVALSQKGLQTLSDAVPVWETCQASVDAELGSDVVQALQTIIGAA